MADKLKPENIEIVERIRKFEDEMFKEHSFKLYRNYHVPEDLIQRSTKVLSFGVGGDAHFEKLICFDNEKLQVHMFDPTPYTVKNIGSILSKGGHHQFKNYANAEELSKKIIQNNLTFKPYAYAPENGKLKFYYKTQTDASLPVENLTSFSLACEFDNPENYVEVECRNIKTIMNDIGWDKIDILKTDVEGLWYDVGKELQDLDVKYWLTEIELGLGETYDESFEKLRHLCKIHSNEYNIYVNRKRLKAMMEIIFYRKDIDES